MIRQSAGKWFDAVASLFVIDSAHGQSPPSLCYRSQEAQGRTIIGDIESVPPIVSF